jgi:hypothetical protein
MERDIQEQEKWNMTTRQQNECRLCVRFVLETASGIGFLICMAATADMA